MARTPIDRAHIWLVHAAKTSNSRVRTWAGSRAGRRPALGRTAVSASLLSAPVLTVLGTAAADWRTRVLAMLLAGSALALHRWLERKHLQHARRDPNTGVLASRAWKVEAVRRLQRAGRQDLMVGLLLIQIDRPAPDQLESERRLVMACQRHLGCDDLVGLPAPGQMVIMTAPGGTTSQLVELAEQLRSSAVNAVAPPAGTAVSIGGAMFPQDAGRVEDLLTVADNALLAAQSRRRHRVCIVGAGSNWNRVAAAVTPTPVAGLAQLDTGCAGG